MAASGVITLGLIDSSSDVLTLGLSSAFPSQAQPCQVTVEHAGPHRVTVTTAGGNRVTVEHSGPHRVTVEDC